MNYTAELQTPNAQLCSATILTHSGAQKSSWGVLESTLTRLHIWTYGPAIYSTMCAQTSWQLAHDFSPPSLETDDNDDSAPAALPPPPPPPPSSFPSSPSSAPFSSRLPACRLLFVVGAPKASMGRLDTLCWPHGSRTSCVPLLKLCPSLVLDYCRTYKKKAQLDRSEIDPF